MTIFAPAESLPSPATLPSCIHMEIIKKKPRKRIGLNPALKICQNKLSISYNVYFWRLNFKMRTESKVTMGLHSIQKIIFPNTLTCSCQYTGGETTLGTRFAFNFSERTESSLFGFQCSLLLNHLYFTFFLDALAAPYLPLGLTESFINDS